jgi:hypothetical protein
MLASYREYDHVSLPGNCRTEKAYKFICLELRALCISLDFLKPLKFIFQIIESCDRYLGHIYLYVVPLVGHQNRETRGSLNY